MVGFNKILGFDVTNPWGMISTSLKGVANAQNKSMEGILGTGNDYDPYKNRHDMFVSALLASYGYLYEEEQVAKQNANKKALGELPHITTG